MLVHESLDFKKKNVYIKKNKVCKVKTVSFCFLIPTSMCKLFESSHILRLQCITYSLLLR